MLYFQYVQDVFVGLRFVLVEGGAVVVIVYVGAVICHIVRSVLVVSLVS